MASHTHVVTRVQSYIRSRGCSPLSDCLLEPGQKSFHESYASVITTWHGTKRKEKRKKKRRNRGMNIKETKGEKERGNCAKESATKTFPLFLSFSLLPLTLIYILSTTMSIRNETSNLRVPIIIPANNRTI